MKKFFTSAIFSISVILSSYAQSPQLWGLTSSGGTNNFGTIIKINGDGTGFAANYSFQEINSGAYPHYTDMLQATDGLLYGITQDGGANNLGIIFSYNPNTSTYTDLHDFNDPNGVVPEGSLIQASNGLLYGMASGGGGDGTIFSYNPVTATYIDLLDFNGTNGADPTGSLVQASDGLLYGMTEAGGANRNGVLFSYNLNDSTYTDLLDFNDTTGADPFGSLIQASNGLLYGMTEVGGANYGGVLFSYNPITANYTDLFNFNDTTGASPLGSLLQDSNGLLYGMTSYGGTYFDGVIFSYDLVTAAYTDLLDFNGTNGYGPNGNLMQASNGLLYGMTEAGGANADGVLFSYNPVTAVYADLLDFNGINGVGPTGSLMQASNGLFYGMTSAGGVNNDGVLFSYMLDNASYTDLLDFTGSHGGTPYGSLIQASNGLLYGMSYFGENGRGNIFSYNPVTSAYTDLLDFNDTIGSEPKGGLIQASNGLLYGTTVGGGANEEGVLFSYNPVSAVYADLLDFNGINGSGPSGSLMEASNGLLYGMTTSGGAYGEGIIFNYNPVTGTDTDLLDFSGINGVNPSGSLIQASNGLLYGMTGEGGGRSLEGVLFCYNPVTATDTDLVTFYNSGGADPYGSLIQASDGLLYGMTTVGGAHDSGLIFSYNIGTATYTDLLDFSTNGGFPYGNLIQASNGLLYGMTWEGGANGDGVIFSYNINTATYTDMKDLSFASGYNPKGSLIEIHAPNAINTGTVNGPLCAGSGIAVPFIVDSIFIVGNVFTAQLSDVSGSFASPVNIGMLTDTTGGTITATIPANTANGIDYKIRVISSNPPDTGNNNGSNIAINDSVVPSVSISANPAGAICSGTNVQFAATPYNGGVSPGYQWVANGNNIGGNSATYNDNAPNNNDSVWVIMTSKANCANPAVVQSSSLSISVNTLPGAPNITKMEYTLTSSPANSYQWYLNDTTINGATNQSLTISQNGQYQVQITDFNGCQNTSAIFAVTTLGISEIDIANGVKLYPNPTSDELIVQSDLFANNEIAFKLYDVAGKLQSVNYAQRAGQLTINTGSLAAGMYWLEININGQEVGRKFVKD